MRGVLLIPVLDARAKDDHEDGDKDVADMDGGSLRYSTVEVMSLYSSG